MIREQPRTHRGRVPRPSFVVGRSSCGGWVVRATGGGVEAAFLNRTEAIRFALAESGHQPGAVVLAPYIGLPQAKRGGSH
ncbi:hypothetical protein QNA08_16975 [Chelatococcus sp. SYSU_G07232]|uniref:DUF2188 domain-containing protein n=1 Tax=Chelatococcus albus TaxID=3047466 RepID=A0ABT7AKL8_9HYPH|nr:hypothetical protein [Chelatococcus sp. SYSU_G07232]MDJ1159913.1 hypothetical protein [Chelatococcus sp. SYSU_G07232]